MYKYNLVLLFVLIPITSLLADEIKVAGAFKDLTQKELANIPCPNSLSFSIQDKNQDLAILAGADGRVDSISFVLSLSRIGYKGKKTGKCFYNVTTKELTLKKNTNELVNIVDKDTGSDELATAFRNVDFAGEQVVGLRVPLAQNYYLSFAEIPLEVVYGVKTNPDGGNEFVLKSNQFKASSKIVRKVVRFDPKTRQPRVNTENFGEIALVVSIKD